MTAFVTSVLPAQEVIKLMLEKYKVESEPSQFALYVVKETGGKGPYINDVRFSFRIFESPLVCSKFTQPPFLWSKIG